MTSTDRTGKCGRGPAAAPSSRRPPHEARPVPSTRPDRGAAVVGMRRPRRRRHQRPSARPRPDRRRRPAHRARPLHWQRGPARRHRRRRHRDDVRRARPRQGRRRRDFTVRQAGGNSTASPSTTTCRNSGVGDEYVLFMPPASKLGLASPVGLLRARSAWCRGRRARRSATAAISRAPAGVERARLRRVSPRGCKLAPAQRTARGPRRLHDAAARQGAAR